MLAAGPLTCAPMALAQTASQITPASTRPAGPQVVRGIVVPEMAGPSAPAGADGLQVTLAGVDIEGGDLGDAIADQKRDLAAALVGKSVSVAEIFKAARDLEAAYARAGYVLSRVVVPAQRLKDGGRLKIVVIAGFIERIETASLPATIRSSIEATLAPIIGRRSLRLSEIERALVLAGDTPGATLKSTLAKGDKPGGSILVIEAQYKPVTGSIATDNTMSSSLGHVNSTIALQLNSIFGQGERIYTQVSGYPDPTGSRGFFEVRPVNRQLSAGIVLPLGSDGLTLNLEAIGTDSAPDPTAGQLFYSQFERFSGRLRYPWLRSRAVNLASELAFDVEQEDLSAISPIGVPISQDRLRVLRDTTEISAVTGWGAFVSGRVTASLGLDAFGARDAASATPTLPLSRQGTDASFGKLEISGHYGQALLPHLGIDLFGRAQTSFGQALARAEQIGLVGMNGLSAFDSGSFQGDSGLVGRLEVSSPWAVDLPSGIATASPYAFSDYGSVWLMKPTAVEQRQIDAASWGLGLRLAAAPPPTGSTNPNPFSGIIDQATLSIEWGRQYRTDGTRAVDRVTFYAAIQF